MSYDPKLEQPEGVLLPSAARTSAVTLVNQKNSLWRGLLLYLDVTVVPGSAPSLTLNVQGVPPLGSDLFSLLGTVSAVTGTGLYIYQIAPGAPTGASGVAGVTLSQNGALPRTWLPSVAHGNGNSVTYSLTYSYVL